MSISREELLRGLECPPALEANLELLLSALNQFRSVYGKPMRITSGFREPAHNQAVGGRPKSAHLTCQAADIADTDRTLSNFCLNNIPLLEKCGLWMEDPAKTVGWIHLQIRPASRRIFTP